MKPEWWLELVGLILLIINLIPENRAIDGAALVILIVSTLMDGFDAHRK